nr:hypothetical protein [Candidatus Sigynarchaeota archaeon]
MQLHIALENIDTFIEITPTHKPIKRHFRTPEGRKAIHKRLLVFDAQFRSEILSKQQDISAMLKKENPDVDIDSAGVALTRTARIVVDKDLKPIYTFKEFDVMTRPDGTRQERPHKPIPPNADEPIPVKITDKLLDPVEVATKFVISRSFFLSHTDGVSYKFLYEIAKNLSTAGKFARLQAFDPITKKPAPLVLRESAKPYPGVFLEGRIRGDEYCLMLHLSDQELKIPEATVAPKEGDTA